MNALADVVRGMDALADIVVLRPWRLITTLETGRARMWRTSTATAGTRISPLSHRPPQNSMLVGLDEFVSCTVCAQRRSDVWPNIEVLLEGPCIQLEVVAVQAMPSNSMMVLEVERNQAFIIVDRIRLGDLGGDGPNGGQILRVPVSIVEALKATAAQQASADGPVVRLSIVTDGVLFGSSQLGTAGTRTLGELVRYTSATLLVQNEETGFPVVSGSPPIPCEFTLKAVADSLPKGWSRPKPPPYEGRRYKRHVFMMTRGTRGDVQPFVALAVGMANQQGWLVTVCTELYWREFVEKHAQNLDNGAIRFLPCGGDTHLETSSWFYSQAMQNNSDAMQTVIMAASEWNFFPSTPVIVHQVAREQKGEHPIDLLICGFTLVGVCMLASEKCGVPMAGFIAQAAAIPTVDPSADQILFGAQAARKTIKSTFENFLLNPNALPNLRSDFGLSRWKATWPTIFKQAVPMVIPMHPETFTRPADWGPHVSLTDFIFLRPKNSSSKPLATELQDFIDVSRAAGRKIMLMTFSSMPVPRRSIFRVAIRMLRETKHKMSLIFVGKGLGMAGQDLVSASAELIAAGQLMEVENADFGSLFPQLDAFIVHGGLGTTVEAIRTRKPVAVTGILLMDQRFWADVVCKKLIGPEPATIDKFYHSCVEFADKALDPDSEWAKAAAALTFGSTRGDDGVRANVNGFKALLDGGVQAVR